ncbi:hypothetical protein COCSUDRAFT_67457, partial [Coccomyxa subellipsoidea C-169]
MKKQLALAAAIFGLLALASVAHCDSGSSGSGGLGSSFGGRSGISSDILGGRNGGSENSGSSFSGNSERSRNVDRWGGYWNSDNHYWWNGGYWEGGCYGCGQWICYGCNYPSCPPCQWFNHQRWECEYTETCNRGSSN